VSVSPRNNENLPENSLVLETSRQTEGDEWHASDQNFLRCGERRVVGNFVVFTPPAGRLRVFHILIEFKIK
jgi:hypothetical protein